MQKILISYRHEDSAAYAGRLADRLGEHFGRESVFVDVDAIRPGEDFVEVIDQSLSTCTVLLAVIGRGWLNAADSAGRRRLDRTDDFVRTEIAKALERHLRVIPVLVADASMPEPKDLPQDLVALTRRQAMEISDSRFHQDVDRLIEAVSGVPGNQPRRRPTPEATTVAAGKDARQRMWILAPMFLLLAAVVLVWRYLPDRGTTTDGSRIGNPQAQATSPGTSESPAPSGPSASSEATPVPSSPLDAPGKTGIRIVWRGANSVPCYLYDATGEKLLSPSGVVFAWRCAADADLWDAAPGRYVVKVGTPTVDPIQVVVTRGSVTRVEPRVGQLQLHWNGSNRVFWFLLDKDGQKTLSPEGVIWAWTCEPGQTSTADVAPGDYLVKVDAPGYQPARVSIVAFRATHVTIP